MTPVPPVGGAAGTGAACPTENVSIRDYSQSEWGKLAKETWKGYSAADRYGRRLGEALFIQDPETKRVVSESKGFGRLITQQLGMQADYRGLKKAGQKMMERGFSYWVGQIEGGEYKVGDPKQEFSMDQAKTSAADADQDILYSELQEWQRVKDGEWGGDEKEISYNIQRQLNMFWSKQVDSNDDRALPKPFEFAQNLKNISYISAAMIAAWQEFDSNDQHDWIKVAQDSIVLRSAIIGDTTTKCSNNGKKYEYVRTFANDGYVYVYREGELGSYTGIPDWVDMKWEGKHLKLMPSPDGKSFKQGYDAIRTLWRVAADVMLFGQMARRTNNKKIWAMYRRCIEQARFLMDKVKIKCVPFDIELYDKSGGIMSKQIGREMILASYTALAYAAGAPYHKQYLQLSSALKKMDRKGFFAYNNSNGYPDAEAKTKYYDQSIILLCLLVLKGNFKEIFKGRFKLDRPKDKQLLAEKHWRYPFIHLKYLTLPGPKDKPELGVMQNLHWLKGENPRRERVQRVRVKTAGSLQGLQHFYGAINEYKLVLRYADYTNEKQRKHIERAYLGILGAIRDSGMPPVKAVRLFKGMLSKNPSNPYLELGLARAYLSTYATKYLLSGGAKELAVSVLKKHQVDPTLNIHALSVLADIYLRQAKQLKNSSFFETAKAILRAAAGAVTAQSPLAEDIGNNKYRDILFTQKKMLPDLTLRKSLYKKRDQLLSLQKLGVLVQYAEVCREQGEASNKQESKEHFKAAAREYFSVLSILEKEESLLEGLTKEADVPRPLYASALTGAIISVIGSGEIDRGQEAAAIALAALSGKKVVFDPNYPDRARMEIIAKVAMMIGKTGRFTEKARKDKAATLTRAEYFELKTVLLGLAQRQDSNRAMEDFRRILGGVPRARIRSHFERIRYFLEESGDRVKAKKDIESVIGIFDGLTALSDRSLFLEDSVIWEMNNLIGILRRHQRKPIANIRAIIDGVKNKLIASPVKNPRSDKALKALNKVQEGKYEDTIEEIERAIEEEVVLKEYKRRYLVLGGLNAEGRKALEILGKIKGVGYLLKENKITKAIETIAEISEECRDKLNEPPLDTVVIEKLLGAYGIFCWSLVNTGNNDDPIVLLEEILSPYSGSVKNPTAGWALYLLRDKEIRGLVDSLLKGSAYQKSRILEQHAQIHRLKNSIRSIGSYRRSLGLPNARPKNIADEDKEYSGILKSRPDLAGTIYEIVKIENENNNDEAARRMSEIKKGARQ